MITKLPVILVLCFFLIYCTSSVYSQTQKVTKTGEIIVDTTDKVDIIDVFKSRFSFNSKKIKPRKGKKVYFSLLPVSVPGGGKGIITSTSAGFYFGDRRNTSLSNVYFSPYLNFKGKYSIAFKSNVFTSRNKFNIIGDTRFSLYPEYVYGGESYKDKVFVNYKYIRFYQTVLKKLKPYLLVGLGYNLDYHFNIRTVGDTIELPKFTGYQYGTSPGKNSVSSGVTFNILYDTRNNAINPLPGAYANLIYRVNPSYLGNGSNTWKSIYFDLRKYVSLPGEKRRVMAFWTYAWSALNNNVPYLDLPGIGYETYQRSGRGFDQNRHRGKSLVYVEGEYRSDLTQNGLLGFVAFTNIHVATAPGSNRFSGPYPAIGSGLRLKFNKRSNTNIAFDIAISKGNTSFALNLGEAF